MSKPAHHCRHETFNSVKKILDEATSEFEDGWEDKLIPLKLQNKIQELMREAQKVCYEEGSTTINPSKSLLKKLIKRADDLAEEVEAHWP